MPFLAGRRLRSSKKFKGFFDFVFVSFRCHIGGFVNVNIHPNDNVNLNVNVNVRPNDNVNVNVIVWTNVNIIEAT